MNIKKLFAVPHFHFDVEWWKTIEGHAEDAKIILEKALEMLDKYPEFTYVLDQALSVKPFWDQFPEKREKLKRYISQGRIEVVGATYAAPDLNIPTGEALVRQFIYGKNFFRDLLGAESKVGWQIDEFGHPHQIPQIHKKAGMSYYVFARGIIPYNSMHPINFYWVAPDGSKVLANWFAASYSSLMPFSKSPSLSKRQFEKEINARLHYEGKRQDAECLMIPFGSDFTIPSENWLSFVEEWNAKKKPVIDFSLPGYYFKEVEGNNFHVYKDKELNPVFSGCYESREKVKKYCRITQHKILSAEKLNALAYAMGKEYPNFDRAWKNLLENDFHDTICGTGTDKVYRKTLFRYEEALNIIENAQTEALHYLSDKIDTQETEGLPVIVFNTLAHEREDVAEVILQETNPDDKGMRVYDNEGIEIPCQREGNKIVFTASIPPLGYKVYYLKENPKTGETAKITPSTNFTLENSFYTIQIDNQTGGIKSIYDRENGQEILHPRSYLGNEILIEEDAGNLWTVSKTGKEYRWHNYPVKIQTEQKGPVRTVINIESRLHQSRRIQKIIVYNDIRRIDFQTNINFHGKDKRFRVIFPPHIKGKAVHETPFYCADNREHGHWPVQNFVDVSDGNYGFALLNVGNPGYEVRENELSLVLFRSVSLTSTAFLKYLAKNSFDILKTLRLSLKYQLSGLNIIEYPLYKHHNLMLREWSTDGGPDCFGSGGLYSHLVANLKVFEKFDCWEQGEHEFKYSIYPHKGDYKEAKLPQKGLEFNNPLITWVSSRHKGELPGEFSFCRITNDNIILSSLKKSENEDSLTMRCYETNGADSTLNMEFFKNIKKIRETSLTEDDIYKKEEQSGKKIKLNMGKWEIKTLKFKMNDSTVL